MGGRHAATTQGVRGSLRACATRHGRVVEVCQRPVSVGARRRASRRRHRLASGNERFYCCQRQPSYTALGREPSNDSQAATPTGSNGPRLSGCAELGRPWFVLRVATVYTGHSRVLCQHFSPRTTTHVHSHIPTYIHSLSICIYIRGYSIATCLTTSNSV